MKSVLRALGSGISITIMVAIAFSLLIWFLGPHIAIGETRPWGSEIALVITLGVIALLALTMILIIVIRKGRKDKEMAEDIVETADTTTADVDDEFVIAELSELKGKLKEAMGTLRKSKLGRRSLYELPWYVMIGPPGAGKTTAIVNSGLNFPLADTLGKEAIGGVGGTRNCDWWFTDNAVMIDTAGRYTTQDSDADEDNVGWLGFLNLLKKHRKRQPINGAIVAISLSDLSMQDEETQSNHAAAISRRLKELREKLGVRFPVYVLFTKSDLMVGFTEFFDALSKDDREQVWGFTLPLPKKKKSQAAPIDALDEEFTGLLNQLNAHSLEIMQHEIDPQRRSLIASFPSQVASVRSTAKGFLNQIFQENRYEDRHLLRGVYFTSGTQEGAPIDRLMMGMARTFGIGRQAIGSGRGSGRSFFLTRLFEDVIFSEAGMVSADDKVERRYRWTKRTAIAAAIVAGLGLGGFWARSYLGNSDLIAEATDKVDQFRTAASTIENNPVKDSDLPGVVPALNLLRDIPGNPVGDVTRNNSGLGFGLYQGGVVGNQAIQTYQRALNELFLPRILLRLEDQMQANMNNREFLFEALKVYLMLGKQGPMDQNLITEWTSLDWDVAYRGNDRAALRADLDGHLKELLAQPMDTIELNGPLIEQIRDLLSDLPLARRLYNGIISSPAATSSELSVFRLTSIGGANLDRAIVRSSGAALSEGIPGIFTRKGFHTVFLDEALSVEARATEEAWVLPTENSEGLSELDLAFLSRDVLDLYYTDYLAHYEELLGDADIIPLENLRHAVEITQILSQSSSPISNILETVAEETKLTVPPQAEGLAEALPEGAADAVTGGAGVLLTQELTDRLSQRQRRVFELMQTQTGGGGSANAEPPAPGQEVEDRFEQLHQITERIDQQPSTIDNYLSILIEVSRELQSLQNGDGAATDDSTAIIRFREFSETLPQPLRRWSTQITSGSSGITATGTRASIDSLWKSEVLPTCQQALSNRYPLNRSAETEVGIADFKRLFAPEGMIDGFFNTHLREYVDTRSRPWKWKTVNETDLGISDAVLLQFQYASQIRDTFFAGGPDPDVTFQMEPFSLDERAQEVTLEVNGETLVYRHGEALRAAAFKWPGGVGQGAVVFQPIIDGTSNVLRRNGPWALFRLLDTAELRSTSAADRSLVIFNVGGRAAVFKLQSTSVFNPFALPALQAFKCPSSF